MTALLRLLPLLRPVAGPLALAIGLGVATLLANVTLMALSGWFIAAMAVAGAAGTSLNYFTPAALIRAMAIGRSLGRYGERLVGHDAALRLIATLRVWLFRRIEPRPMTVWAAFHHADLAGRLRVDLDRLEMVALRLVAPLCVALLGTVLVTAWVARIDGGLALLLGGTLICAGLGLPACLAPGAIRQGEREAQARQAASEAAVDLIEGLPDLLAFGAAPARVAALIAHTDAMIDAQTAQARRLALAQAGHAALAHLAAWGSLVAGAGLLAAGRLAGPDLVMLSLLALAAFEAVAPLPAALLGLGPVRDSARRILALADGDGSPAEPAGADAPPPERCDLRAEGVGFSWRAGAAPALARLDLDLPHGTRLALVGPPGSGKSTLALLLTGLIRPDHGRITLNDATIDALGAERWRRCFAVAPQDGGLFSGRVGAVVRLGAPAADDATVWHALSLVGLAEFVAALPQGLDTWLGEAGQTLSGGQARRLAVARAWLRPAPVLILDEPGEGLDPAAEAAMLDRLIDSLAGRSLVLITHGRAGLARMDRVVTLDQGTRLPRETDPHPSTSGAG